MKISSVLGNSQMLDGGAMFGNAPKALWKKWLKPDEKNRIMLHCRCLLLETKSEKILFETGIGNFFSPKLKERFGVLENRHVLIDNLAAKGVRPEEITKIVLSHMHFDHAGGLLKSFSPDQPLQLAFENATIYTSKLAWDRAISPHMRDRASFISDLHPLIKDKLVLIDRNQHTDLPFVEFFYTHGHTPGQLHSLIQTGKEALFFCGDLIPGKHWMHGPITMGYDRCPETLIDEKIQVLENACRLDWTLFFTHDPAIAASKVQKNEQGKFTPLHEMTELEIKTSLRS